MNLHSTEPLHDYVELVNYEIGPFSNTECHHCFNISINDDLILENAVNFLVILNRDPGTTRVSVDPNLINIIITDNDSKLSLICNKYNLSQSNNANGVTYLHSDC